MAPDATVARRLLIHLTLPLLVSACVALTGGISSLFTSLYVLPIVAASMTQFRRGALQVAAFGSTLYGSVVVAQYFHVTEQVGSLLGVALDFPLPPTRVALYT